MTRWDDSDYIDRVKLGLRETGRDLVYEADYLVKIGIPETDSRVKAHREAAAVYLKHGSA